MLRPPQRHGMIGHEEQRAAQIDLELRREGRPVEPSRTCDLIQPGRAHDMHAPRMLPHLDDALPVGLRRNQGQVRQLRHGVAHGLIDLSFGALAPVQMG